MKIAPVPAYERERLKTLDEYYILDTLPESDFDDIARLAATICNTPMAFIGFIDPGRMWFKSRLGFTATETSRDNIFCSQAINEQYATFIVEDLVADGRFGNNPFVTGDTKAVYYAGVPLVSPGGQVLGILSVMDTRARIMEAYRIKALQSLAKQVIAQLEVRKKGWQLKQKQAEINMAYADLESIAYLASHDLNSPLNNIISLSDLVKSEYAKQLGVEGVEYVNFISESADNLAGLISGVRKFSKAARMSVGKKEKINVDAFMKELLDSLKVPDNTTIHFTNEGKNILSNTEALKLILLHLVKNAIQYCDKPRNIIDIRFSSDKYSYTFKIKDNGEGIAEADKERMFILFRRLKGRKKTIENMGVGMPIVKRLIEKLSGTLKIHSDPGLGTTAVFTIPKQ